MGMLKLIPDLSFKYYRLSLENNDRVMMELDFYSVQCQQGKMAMQ